MKKVLIGLGIVFICLLILGVIGISMAAYHGTKLDKSSKAYVDEVSPIIFASWNPQELLNRASPELLKVVPADKLNTIFNMLSEKLGRLKEYKESKGSSYMRITTEGKTVTATYIVRAVFEKGDAETKVTLIQHNNKWQIASFFVNSETLLLPDVRNVAKNSVPPAETIIAKDNVVDTSSLSSIKLSATSASGEPKSRIAVINDGVYHIGDSVAGYKIDEIKENFIVLVDDKGNKHEIHI